MFPYSHIGSKPSSGGARQAYAALIGDQAPSDTMTRGRDLPTSYPQPSTILAPSNSKYKFDAEPEDNPPSPKQSSRSKLTYSRLLSGMVRRFSIASSSDGSVYTEDGLNERRRSSGFHQPRPGNRGREQCDAATEYIKIRSWTASIVNPPETLRVAEGSLEASSHEDKMHKMQPLSSIEGQRPETLWGTMLLHAKSLPNEPQDVLPVPNIPAAISTPVQGPTSKSSRTVRTPSSRLNASRTPVNCSSTNSNKLKRAPSNGSETNQMSRKELLSVPSNSTRSRTPPTSYRGPKQNPPASVGAESWLKELKIPSRQPGIRRRDRNANNIEENHKPKQKPPATQTQTRSPTEFRQTAQQYVSCVLQAPSGDSAVARGLLKTYSRKDSALMRPHRNRGYRPRPLNTKTRDPKLCSNEGLYLAIRTLRGPTPDGLRELQRVMDASVSKTGSTEKGVKKIRKMMKEEKRVVIEWVEGWLKWTWGVDV